MKNVGLRIDVDTWRGTRDGMPRLLELLAAQQIQATFFSALGRIIWGVICGAWQNRNFVEDVALPRRFALRLGYPAGRHRLAG